MYDEIDFHYLDKTKINKEHVKKWIDSFPYYVQKRGSYHNLDYNNAFCAIGVLLDISKKGTWIPLSPGSEYAEYSVSPEKVVREWLNVEPVNSIPLFVDDIIYLNDGMKCSFKEIAQIIKEILLDEK